MVHSSSAPDTHHSCTTGAVAFYMLCFTTLPELGVFILSYAAFISAITYLTVASMNSSQFGSQPPCNSHLVSSPFRIPGGALLFALAAGPWVFAIVGIVLWKVREVCACARASAASIAASEEHEMSQIEGRWTGPDAEVASRVVACWRNLTCVGSRLCAQHVTHTLPHLPVHHDLDNVVFCKRGL